MAVSLLETFLRLNNDAMEEENMNQEDDDTQAPIAYDRRRANNQELGEIHKEVRLIRDMVYKIDTKKQDKISIAVWVTVTMFTVGAIVAGVTSYTVTSTKLDGLIETVQQQSTDRYSAYQAKADRQIFESEIKDLRGQIDDLRQQIRDIQSKNK